MRMFCLLLLSSLSFAGCQSSGTKDESGASVIFMHHDGMAASSWAAVRALYVGPDNDLNWDKLPAIAVYRGHAANRLTASSNSGATTHATGVRVETSAFGRFRSGEDAPRLVDDQGKPLSIALQAMDAGLSVGLVQTGIGPEPGTACFVTDSDRRNDYEGISAQLVESGCAVLMSGGERYYLPKGVDGRHGPGERSDGRNLIKEAQAKGYTVVYTRDELAKLPEGTERVFGVFAWDATFNAEAEEKLIEKGLPHFVPGAPTVAEMTDAALKVLGNKDKRFFLVVEEEGTDNFGNNNNAAGVLKAGWYADQSYGVAQRYLEENPRTLLITCADSDGGGMRLMGLRHVDGKPLPDALPERGRNGAPIDGATGSATAPFLAQPNKAGLRLPFVIVWPTYSDVTGGVLVRAQGYNSDRVKGNMDNTEVAELMRDTLFGR